MSIIKKILQFLFKSLRSRNQSTASPEPELSYEGLNPLLAKQLSELETQIGQLAQVQFDLTQERQHMRNEMEALKKAIGESKPEPTPDSPSTPETFQ